MSDPLILGEPQDWASLDAPSLILDGIFADAGFKRAVLEQWRAYSALPDRPLVKLARDFWPGMDVESWDLYPLVALIRMILYKEASAGIDTFRKVAELEDFLGRFPAEIARYRPVNKPNPDAVFWPDPTREKGPRSLFDTLPFVRNHGLVTKETPVGSAGSCFAIEVASSLQERGYNYIVTEAFSNADKSVFYPDFRDTTRPVFSANWGILFNSPSFMQVAERAFGEKEFPRLLVRLNDRYYTDPFREQVMFSSPAAYIEDYEKHTAASRDALLKSEVFIVTMGLNECWEYLPDGSFLHRNPLCNELFTAVRHRTLTVEENVRYLQRFYDIVRAHNPKFKLIVSVSPIPFVATGRAEHYHVVTANTHSKAVQRVAAEILAEANKDVHYLPSYEMVTTCIRDAWDDDQRHVKRSTVDRVMELFARMFVA